VEENYRYTSGNGNIGIGTYSGYNNTAGSYNVFLGYGAGYNETGSNKLYIENSYTTTPLIYGEFDNNIHRVSGEFQVVSPFNFLRLANTTTNATTKSGRIVINHYTNSAMPFHLISGASSVSSNHISIGGGTSDINAASQIDLYTAANSTTATGTARLTIMSNGYIGMQRPSSISYPLHMGSGARCTTGGVWTDASSRTYKEKIATLDAGSAKETLDGLTPVTFAYKADPKETHVGFIAENVPDLVATKDRKGLSPMDIVAVVTKVVKDQQKTIQDQQKEMKDQQKAIAALTEELNELKHQVWQKASVSQVESK